MNLPLRQLERQRGGPRLPLGGEGPRAFSVDCDLNIVLMRAGETLAGIQFRLSVALLMVTDVEIDLLFGAEGSFTVLTVWYASVSSSVPPENSG